MLEGLQPPRKVYTCAVRTVLSTLDKADAAILTQALSDVELWPAKTLSKALRERSLMLSDNTIANHRRQACSCYTA